MMSLAEHCPRKDFSLMTQTPPAEPLVIDPDTAAFLAEPADRRWGRFLGYWQDLSRRLGRWPGRRDVDPLEMGGDLLGSLFLIDIEKTTGENARQRYRFRLLGDEITGREVVRPGMYLDELGSDSALTAIERHYEEARVGRIRLRETTLQWEARGKEHIRYSVMMLPLLGDTGDVAHLIGCAIYEDERQR